MSEGLYQPNGKRYDCCASCGEHLMFGLIGEVSSGSCLQHSANYCRECFNAHLVEAHGAPRGWDVQDFMPRD